MFLIPAKVIFLLHFPWRPGGFLEPRDCGLCRMNSVEEGGWNSKPQEHVVV